MTRLLLIVLSLLFLALVFLVEDSTACCKVKGVGSCCGKGKCNVFCCNCNGGCRPDCDTATIPFPVPGGGGRIRTDPARGKRAALKFDAVDADGDGFVDYEEALAYLSENGGNGAELRTKREWWEHMDADKNGVLAPGEFDAALDHPHPPNEA
jgi:hypothetical protein